MIARLLDYRYVYLMHRPWRGFLRGEYKIGIARNVNTRRRDVDDDVPGDVEVIAARRIIFARAVEIALHDHYARRRFRLNVRGKKAGKTEWFRLNFLQRISIVLRLNLLADWWIYVALAVLEVLYLSTPL